MQKWEKIVCVFLCLALIIFQVVSSASNDWHSDMGATTMTCCLFFYPLCRNGIALYKGDGEQWKKVVTIASGIVILIIGVMGFVWHLKSIEVHVIIDCLPALILLLNLLIIGMVEIPPSAATPSSTSAPDEMLEKDKNNSI